MHDNTRGDRNVILSTIVTIAMVKVH